MAGSRLSKQGNRHTRLVLGSQKRHRFLQPPTRILKVYTETLTAFSHIFSPDGLRKRPSRLSQACVPETGPTVGMGNGERNILSKEKGANEEPLIACVQLSFQPAIVSSP